ncbi:uncharacterized protein [Miscanthus floridulus]|uniref:uncharacterized protein n=1 Tax=Miscanthus floridulus TaxID=154761 RepID=UPI00345B020F
MPLPQAISSARWASATQTPRPPSRRDVGTDSERGGSGAHELLRTGAILSERVLIGIGLEKSNQIQGEVPDPPSKVQTSPDKESFDKALTKESMKLLATLAAIRLDEAVGNHLIHVPPVRGRRFLRRKL